MNHWLLQLYLRRVRGRFNTFILSSFFFLLSHSDCKLQSIDKVLGFFLFFSEVKKKRKVEKKNGRKK